MAPEDSEFSWRDSLEEYGESFRVWIQESGILPPPLPNMNRFVASCNAALLYAMHYPYNPLSVHQPALPSRIRDPMHGSHAWTCVGAMFYARERTLRLRPADGSAGAGV